MRYYYTRTSGNCVRIDSIAYTGNHYTGQAPFNTIVFVYNTLNAVFPKYVKNMKIQEQQHIVQIVNYIYVINVNQNIKKLIILLI